MTAKRCLGEADAICAPYATGRHYQERPPPENRGFQGRAVLHLCERVAAPNLQHLRRGLLKGAYEAISAVGKTGVLVTPIVVRTNRGEVHFPPRLLRLYQDDSVNLWTFEGPVTPRREPSVLHRLAKTLDDGAPPKPLRGGRQSAGPDSAGKAGFRLAALILAVFEPHRRWLRVDAVEKRF
jgi:hypothetical protein